MHSQYFTRKNTSHSTVFNMNTMLIQGPAFVTGTATALYAPWHEKCTFRVSSTSSLVIVNILHVVCAIKVLVLAFTTF